MTEEQRRESAYYERLGEGRDAAGWAECARETHRRWWEALRQRDALLAALRALVAVDDAYGGLAEIDRDDIAAARAAIADAERSDG